MPSGVFNLNIYKSGNLIKSFSFTSANAKAAANLSENYFHIYYSLSTTPFMLPRGTYEIKLEHSGYTFNTSSWMGWCKDLVPFGRLTGTPSDFTENPFSFTILEYQPREI